MTKWRLIFDLDDTLYPERQFAHSGFRAIGQWAALRWQRAELAQEMSEDMEQLLRDGQLGTLFKTALDKHTPSHTADDLMAAQTIYRTHDPEISLYEDAHHAIAHFINQAPMGLITDGSTDMQSTKVRALGIEDRFQEIIFTHEGGGRAYHKPHPWSFEKMETAMGGPSNRFLYVGDNAKKDFVVPNARGWTSVQVRRPGSIHDQTAVTPGGAPRYVIRSLRELRALIDELGKD
ncbi:MAG: HAD family hydrolase [Hyphomicrobiaceae bacterium]